MLRRNNNRHTKEYIFLTQAVGFVDPVACWKHTLPQTTTHYTPVKICTLVNHPGPQGCARGPRAPRHLHLCHRIWCGKSCLQCRRREPFHWTTRRRRPSYLLATAPWLSCQLWAKRQRRSLWRLWRLWLRLFVSFLALRRLFFSFLALRRLFFSLLRRLFFLL